MIYVVIVILTIHLLLVEAVSLSAFRCLAAFLLVKTRKKDDSSHMDIPHVLAEATVSGHMIFYVYQEDN